MEAIVSGCEERVALIRQVGLWLICSREWQVRVGKVGLVGLHGLKVSCLMPSLQYSLAPFKRRPPGVQPPSHKPLTPATHSLHIPHSTHAGRPPGVRPHPSGAGACAVHGPAGRAARALLAAVARRGHRAGRVPAVPDQGGRDLGGRMWLWIPFYILMHGCMNGVGFLRPLITWHVHDWAHGPALLPTGHGSMCLHQEVRVRRRALPRPPVAVPMALHRPTFHTGWHAFPCGMLVYSVGYTSLCFQCVLTRLANI